MRWDTARGGWRAKRPDDAESDEEDVPVATGRLPEPELCLDILTEAEAWPRDEMKASAGGGFTQCVSVWGVPIYATATVPAHRAACISVQPVPLVVKLSW